MTGPTAARKWSVASNVRNAEEGRALIRRRIPPATPKPQEGSQLSRWDPSLLNRSDAVLREMRRHSLGL